MSTPLGIILDLMCPQTAIFITAKDKADGWFLDRLSR